VFAFDNAISHNAYAEDTLIALKMNLNLNCKGKFKNGIMPDGLIQLMHYSDGRPKEIHLVLEKCGLWPERGVNRICSDCKNHSPIANNCCAV